MFKRAIVCVAFVSCGKHLVVNRPLSQASNTVVLSGHAYLIAPVAGAPVHATALSLIPPAVVAEGVTGTDGAFTLTITAIDGDFLVEVGGAGSTIEPATGVEPIPLSQDDKLAAIVLGTSLSGSASVAVNPWSTLVAVRSQTEAAASGGTIADAFKKNAALFSAHFGSANPWEASPIDLVSTAAPGFTSSTIYSLAVLAMSDEALALGARAGTTDVSVVNTLTVLRLLVADQSKDTLFDGKTANQILPAVAGNVHIDIETTRASLADALQDFLGSSKNQSGLSSRDAQDLLNAIRFDTSELYPSGSSDPNRDPTSESGAGPAITVTVPTEGQTLGATTQITATMHDADGIASASIAIDGAVATVPFTQLSTTDWGLAYFPASISDGAHVLELDAADVLGNASSSTVHFTVDRSPPTIAFVACDAPDDRARSVTTSAAGVSYAADTTREGCVETDLNSGAERFYSFADLLLQTGALVPTISIAVADASQVASVTCQPMIDGVLQGTPLPCPTATAPATHSLAISSALFGSGLINVADTSSVRMRVSATDTQGNTVARDFAFSLNVLPAPLYITQVPTQGVALANAHFEDGSIDAVFSASTTWVNLAEYSVENVSPRPVQMPLPTNLYGSYSINVYDALFNNFHIYQDTQFPAETLACAVGKIEEVDLGSGDICSPSWLSTSYTQTDGYQDINVRIQVTSSGAPLTANAKGEVTLAPQTQYTVFVSTSAAQVGGAPYFVRDMRSCVYEPEQEGYKHSYYAGAAATSGGSLIAQNTLWQDTGTNGASHRFYGFLSCDAWRTGNADTYVDTPTGLTTADLPLAGFFDGLRFAAQNNLAEVYVLGNLYLDRGVQFTSGGPWTPTVHLATSGATRPAKPDGSALAFTDHITIDAPKPDLSLMPVYTSNVDVTLPGW